MTSLFLMWFGVDDTSKVALILYAAFFQVLVNVFAGIVTLALTGFVADRLLQPFGCTFLKPFL